MSPTVAEIAPAPRTKEKPQAAAARGPALPPSAMPAKDGPTSLWYDTRGMAQLTSGARAGLFARVANGRFNGVLVHADELDALMPHLQTLPGRFARVLCAETPAQWELVRDRFVPTSRGDCDKPG